ncbi:glycoside hydrolase [Cercophora newfieldiana]|uniref:alpha-1,2-Mannosidase n=1 Tax=Cercophora newfieldiana TaxID=92897 RepID=A0AA39YSH1_9PEZI|nr:glycoside hydrolase [Cercophora newfieldiana]
MSFSIPKNVPSFSNPQRQLEDRLWSSSGVASKRSALNSPSSVLGGVQRSVGDFLGSGSDRAALPMYKDKPYAYAPSGRGRPLIRKKTACGLFVFVLLGLIWWTNMFAAQKETAKGKLDEWGFRPGKAKSKHDWAERRKRVVEAMELSWGAYERYAWGYDEFHPISKSGRNMAPKGLGWIIIDSLDTLMLMNMTKELTHAREWLSKSLTWDQDQDVNTFETTIRMMGGLLSAYYLSTTYPNMAPIVDDDPGQPGEDLYLEKAKDLADRLMAAFDSPSGIPYASVNLGKFKGIESHADGGASSTAEATTLQLEFKYLAKLTGEKDFWDKVEKVIQVVDDNAPKDGLVPIYIHPEKGDFRGNNIRLGSRGDSYYEYLIKQYLQTNKQEPIYEDMWKQALKGVRKHLITYTKHSKFTVLGERPSGLEGDLSSKMDHLVCFMPGTIALAVTGGKTEWEASNTKKWSKQNMRDMQLARELMQTCWGMYKYMATGLAAEITYFKVDDPPLPEKAHHGATDDFDPDPNAEWRKDLEVHSNDAHNLQRPETVESLFYMWRITGEEKYREWGWEMFKSFVNYTAVEDGGGFTSLFNANVIPPVTKDNMESFWLAETLKTASLPTPQRVAQPAPACVRTPRRRPLKGGLLGTCDLAAAHRDKPGDSITTDHGRPTMAPERDLELNRFSFKEGSVAHGSIWSTREPAYLYDEWPRRKRDRGRDAFGRWLDTFRRDPNSRITPKSVVHSAEDRERAAGMRSDTLGYEVSEGVDRDVDDNDDPAREHHGAHYFDLAAANYSTANTSLVRELKGRHLQMIAIGGSIGTGLFVASGKSLNMGGPASLLVAYGFIGIMLYCTVQALGELAVTFPVAGSFSAYSTRFLDPAWGFAMGWNYAVQWLIVLPLEIVAASLTVGYWNSHLSRSVFVTIFLVSIVIINMFGVKGYGEAEFVFAIIKITAVIGFILLGIVINIGGFPDEGYIGGKYWSNPGAFHNGFRGLCSVFVTAAFAFAGTELVGLAAAETANPRKSLPTAIKQVFWRITLFYIVALTLVGLLVPYNHPELLGGAKSMVDVTASPFVIAIESAGIQVLPGVMNGVILVAVISVGNSAVFGSSRTLAALADQRQAPAILGYVDRRGRPLVAILVAALVGLLGYLADLEEQADILEWLLAVSGLSSIFTWGSICLAHIRFRKAWAAKGRSIHELAFRAQAGVLGSWVGLIFNILVLIAQFWTAAFPVSVPKAMDEAERVAGSGSYTTNADPTARSIAQNFFLQYMCVPIVGAFYIGHKLWFRTKVVKIKDMDVDTGRRGFNLPILVAQEREERSNWPLWKRVYKFIC